MQGIKCGAGIARSLLCAPSPSRAEILGVLTCMARCGGFRHVKGDSNHRISVPHSEHRVSQGDPDLHWLPVPPTAIVPLSASERQSGVVLAQ